jgi:hypothetical protein
VAPIEHFVNSGTDEFNSRPTCTFTVVKFTGAPQILLLTAAEGFRNLLAIVCTFQGRHTNRLQSSNTEKSEEKSMKDEEGKGRGRRRGSDGKR